MKNNAEQSGREPRHFATLKPEHDGNSVFGAKSRPCRPCAIRGLNVPAHRVMPNGLPLCHKCYKRRAVSR